MFWAIVEPITVESSNRSAAARTAARAQFACSSIGQMRPVASRLLQLLDRILVLKELIGGDHRNAVPRANLMAQGAPDAARQVDRADLKRNLMPRAGNDADAIDRADDHARLAAGAHVLIEQGQHFGQLLLGHESHCRSGPALNK